MLTVCAVFTNLNYNYLKEKKEKEKQTQIKIVLTSKIQSINTDIIDYLQHDNVLHCSL